MVLLGNVYSNAPLDYLPIIVLENALIAALHRLTTSRIGYHIPAFQYALGLQPRNTMRMCLPDRA